MRTIIFDKDTFLRFAKLINTPDYINLDTFYDVGNPSVITCMNFKSIQRLPEIHEICRHCQRFRMMNILRAQRNGALIFNAINLIFRRTSAGFREKKHYSYPIFSLIVTIS